MGFRLTWAVGLVRAVDVRPGDMIHPFRSGDDWVEVLDVASTPSELETLGVDYPEADEWRLPPLHTPIAGHERERMVQLSDAVATCEYVAARLLWLPTSTPAEIDDRWVVWRRHDLIETQVVHRYVEVQS